MDLNKKLEQLKPKQLNCNVFDVYSYNGLTMQDLLCQFFTKINECITSTNETINLTEWLVNVGLEEEVIKKLMDLIKDGTVEKLINVNLFDSLNNKINNLGSKLEDEVNKLDFKKANITTVWSMANMGQDVKEAMTGGSVSVIGENSVLKENIVDAQVVKRKTSFYEKSINLADREVEILKKGILTTNGEEYENNDLVISPFINIDTSKLNFLYLSDIKTPITDSSVILIAFYDQNKDYISYNDVVTNNVIDCPSNAKYIRYQYHINYYTRYINLLIGDEIHYKYIEPFYLKEVKDLSNKVNFIKSYINKKYLLLGDSITALGNNDYGWEYHFRNIVKPDKVVNIAVNGCTWKDYSDTPTYDGNPTPENHLNVIGNQVQKVINQKNGGNPDYSDFDVIIIACGTNDSYDTNSPETDDSIECEFITDYNTSNYTVKSIDEVNRKTFAGAMRYAYEKLYNLYPNAVFFVTTPLQEVYETYNSIKAKGDLIDYIADRLSINTINTRRCGILNTFESPIGDIDYDNPTGSESGRKRDLSDGIHTNASGGKKLGEYIARDIINYFNF